MFKRCSCRRARSCIKTTLCFLVHLGKTTYCKRQPQIPIPSCISSTSQLLTYHHLTLIACQQLEGQFYHIQNCSMNSIQMPFWETAFLFHKTTNFILKKKKKKKWWRCWYQRLNKDPYLFLTNKLSVPKLPFVAISGEQKVGYWKFSADM